VETHFPRTQAVSSSRSVLEDPEVDAAIIATPAGTHYSLAKEALCAGKHVFVQKPLTHTVKEARLLAEAEIPKFPPPRVEAGCPNQGVLLML
jgi:predicted dehydrogenase